jgi:alanyl-tRNA synthetase
MQFEQVTRHERVDLPHPSIDTGMGLERMASILQRVDSVFETDLFRHLIEPTASALGRGRRRNRCVLPRHCRSSAFVVFPDRRWRAAVERRPGLCAAPHHAPRHAPRAIAGQRPIR